MANTLIQLKYSTVNNTPGSLSIGEPAYSFTSNKLFIGNSTNQVLTIGGKYYVDQIEAATNLATPSTIVLRDSDGSASFNVVTANFINAPVASASKWTNPIDFGLNGDATGNVSVDGSANVTLTVELTNTGVEAKTYGSSSNVPIITVDEDGRLTSVSNAAISTSLGISGDTGTDTIVLGTDVLAFVGGDGITTTVFAANNVVRSDVDNTVIRTTGDQTIDGDFTINGNLRVQGNTTTYNVDSYSVNDPIVLYANNNTDNVVDLGFTAHYVSGGNTRHTGLVKDVSLNRYYLFDNYIPHIQEDHIIDPADPSFALANLEANIVGGSITGLSSAITVPNGGTGATSFTHGLMLVGNGTGALQTVANTGTAGTYGSASYVPVITTDAYGRVSSVNNTQTGIDASRVVSGVLPVTRGGTNSTTYTTGAMLQFNGSAIVSLANSSYTLTGGLSSSNTITSLTVDAYGRLTAATGAEIAISASQITSGTLGVARGGTGATTFTTNGVLLGQGTGAITTASSSTEGHILTINASGVPTFTMLSGGTF
jgi:trimeric autotransporter adhesin